MKKCCQIFVATMMIAAGKSNCSDNAIFVNISSDRVYPSQLCYTLTTDYNMAMLTRDFFCIDTNSSAGSSKLILSDNSEAGDTLHKVVIRFDSTTNNRINIDLSINQHGIRSNASAIGDIRDADVNISQSPNDSIKIHVRKSLPRLIRP